MSEEEEKVSSFVESMPVSEEIKETVRKNLNALASGSSVHYEKRPSSIYGEDGNIRIPPGAFKEDEPGARKEGSTGAMEPAELKCPKCGNISTHTRGDGPMVRCHECGARIPVGTPLWLEDQPDLAKEENREPARKRRISHSFEEDSPEMLRLLGEGKKDGEICSRMEISSATLHQWKKKLGLLRSSREGKEEAKQRKAEREPGPGRRSSRIDEERLKTLVQEGKSAREIAEIMGVTVRSIDKHRRKLGLNIRRRVSPQDERKKMPRKMNAEKLNRLAELWQQGKKDDEIADELDISRGLAQYYRKKLGLAANKRGERTGGRESQRSFEAEVQLTTPTEEPATGKNVQFGYYLEIAERFVAFLEINHRSSYLEFLELETERGTTKEGIDGALEILFRTGKIGEVR